MFIKKSQLYSSIWQSCDALRGGMDASQYKDYVLVLLFVRYVSDKYGGKKDAIGVVPKGGGFSDLVKLKGKTGIGEGVNKVLSTLAEANGLKGVIDNVDFNDENKLGKGKEMQDRLTTLISIFENPDLDFSKNRADGDDLLGDAYEYLMKHFAVESGKSKGQFYTPAEVSRIMAKVIGANKAQNKKTTVYDPTCGSGSLLLKVAAEAPHGISVYGQELDNATAALAVLNMWLHSEPTAVIEKGQSTLSGPLFLEKDGKLKTYDYVVANPPFSFKTWRNGFAPENDEYGRFEGFGGIPPKKNGDLAFLLHIIKSMKSTGQGAVILPHGVLFRGNTEGDIRMNVVKRGYIKGIIGLPANLFYGTGIPACILVLDKEGAASRKGIFMVDASKGFVKDGNKNRLREQDMRKIVDVFNGQIEVPKFSRFAPNEEIEKNEYNLNLPRYIDTQEPEDVQDIDAHLNGGIPNADIEALSDYWQTCPKLQKVLFSPSARKGFSVSAVPYEDIKKTILAHPEYVAFSKGVLGIFNDWQTKITPLLKGIKTTDRPKSIIQNIGDEVLKRFADVHLVDKYDIYQHLMAYSSEAMLDDIYIIAADGWAAGNQVMRLQREAKGDKKESKKDIGGLEGLEGRLIPVSLIVDTYFSIEKKQIDIYNGLLEHMAVRMDELKEEHGTEDGLLSDVIENEKITKGNLTKRIKEIRDDLDYKDEMEILEEYQKLMEEEAETKKLIKTSENDLERKVIAKYPALTLDEILSLVVDSKWMAALDRAIHIELERISQGLTGRVKELSERYKETLPEIEKETDLLNKKVNEHLKKMGFNW